MEIKETNQEADQFRVQYNDRPLFYIPSQLALSAYKRMSPEQKESYHRKWLYMSYGPTGHDGSGGDWKAIVLAVEERHTERIKDLISKMVTLIGSQIDN
jgi:hypothetical protein